MITLQQLHDILARMDYPATRAMLIAGARALDAPEEALARLRELPEHYYGSVDTVMDALRQME